MYEISWMSVIPPLLAIILAIITRQVIISLSIGIWIGFCILESVNPISGLALAIEGVINVFSDPSDTRVLIFTLIIGGLIATIEKVGGVRGFIRLLEERKWVNNAVRAQWLAYLIGVVVFIESNITLLVAGSISRPLFDRYKISREKLAYIIDSTSAPICILIPLNAWARL
jgi:tetracycline resistance efflux pump